MAYRSEHPNPQFRRDSYECLNGKWEYEIGKADGKINASLSSEIEVPFCPESKLSGIERTDFIPDCIYSKIIRLSEYDLKERLVLHFGAVDYRAKVYLNGQKIVEHVGGYTPFEAVLGDAAVVGENRITVVVHDDIREKYAGGKQSAKLESFGCFYTRTTGIWQTVWLERIPHEYIRSFRFFPSVEDTSFDAVVTVEGEGEVTVRALYEGREVGFAREEISYRKRLHVPLLERHLWEIGAGRLYDVEITFGADKIYSYFGLRSTKYEGRKYLLNGESVFQRLVLDQGYYPDGIYTAVDDDTLKRDIALAQALGFNGARLHQKLFEPRYLYYCDKAGYLVWGEYASWGRGYENLDGIGQFLGEWREAVERDFNHPCIVQWCPMNEAWTNLDDPKKVRDVRFVEAVYAFTKALDPTRPCVDVSGGYHGTHTDLYDFHCYHTPEEITEYIKAIEEKNELVMDTLYAKDPEEGTLYCESLPLNASEYGGTAFKAGGQTENGWGYRNCATEADFIEQYVRATEQWLACEKMSGFCYTQLYDVEQEQNGLYTYDRKPKLSEDGMAKIAACNRTKAAIEIKSEKGPKNEHEVRADVTVLSKNIISEKFKEERNEEVS